MRLLVGGAVVVLIAAAIGSGVQARPVNPNLVAVPLVNATDVARAYDRLRAARLRMEVRNSFSASSFCIPGVSHQSPSAGSRVAAGTVIAVSTEHCAIASPAVPQPMPTAVVPRFGGRVASTVIVWAERNRLYWSVRGMSRLLPVRSVPPLVNNVVAPHLFGNYRVIRQQPAPGARLRPGVMVPSGGTRGFRPTPMTVWVKSR